MVVIVNLSYSEVSLHPLFLTEGKSDGTADLLILKQLILPGAIFLRIHAFDRLSNPASRGSERHLTRNAIDVKADRHLLPGILSVVSKLKCPVFVAHDMSG